MDVLKNWQRSIVTAGGNTGALIVDLGPNAEPDGSRIILGASDWSSLETASHVSPSIRRDTKPGVFGGTYYYFVPGKP